MPKAQSKMDKLATKGTQNEEKRSKNTTQFGKLFSNLQLSV
jgi:hypothetical protein